MIGKRNSGRNYDRLADKLVGFENEGSSPFRRSENLPELEILRIVASHVPTASEANYHRVLVAVMAAACPLVSIHLVAVVMVWRHYRTRSRCQTAGRKICVRPAAHVVKFIPHSPPRR